MKTSENAINTNFYSKLYEKLEDLGEYINIFGYNPKYGINGEKEKSCFVN